MKSFLRFLILLLLLPLVIRADNPLVNKPEATTAALTDWFFVQSALSGIQVKKFNPGLDIFSFPIAANTAGQGLALINANTATASNQMFSPYILLGGNGHKTGTSYPVLWRMIVEPVEATSNPNGPLYFQTSMDNGVTWTTVAQMQNGVNLGVLDVGQIESDTSVNAATYMNAGTYLFAGTSVEATTQLLSDVATGTPPLVVQSTTPVPNLAVALAGNLYGTPALPTGTTANTPSKNSNNTLLATAAYVKSPGDILPTSVTLPQATVADGASTITTVIGQETIITNFVTSRQINIPTLTNGQSVSIGLTGVTGAGVITWNSTVQRGNSSGTTFTPGPAGTHNIFIRMENGTLVQTDDCWQPTYVADTGSANAYVMTLVPAISSYTTGTPTFTFKAANANTGASTLNINGVGATAIKKVQGGITTALVANDILAGQICTVVYDGTNFQIISGLGNASAGGWSSSSTNVQTQTALGTTTASGYTLSNTTAASVGAQQYSPAFLWIGQGWGTTAPASAAVAFRAYTVPVQGTTPTGNFNIDVSLSGGAYANEFQLSSAGALTVPGNITCAQIFPNGVSSTGLNTIGYGAGAGGTVTQGTSRTTGVTLNKASGAITLFSAAGSATPFSFTVTDSVLAGTEGVVVNEVSGTDQYAAYVTNIASGSFRITIVDLTGTTSEAPVFKITVLKGSSS